MPALSLHEIEASTRAGSVSAQQAGVQPAAADEGKVSNAAAAADAAAPASAAAARQPREVQLDLAGYDEQEAQQYDEGGEVDVENPEEASLLGGHHARELIGLSVFGVFKLVSFFFVLCRVFGGLLEGGGCGSSQDPKGAVAAALGPGLWMRKGLASSCPVIAATAGRKEGVH